MIDQTRFSENLVPTEILDWEAPNLLGLAEELRRHNEDRQLLQAAHRYLVQYVRPIYTLDELQPASVTLRKQAGSCSQRMACLEAIARGGGIPTRVRALLISGRFWYPRFRALRWFLPQHILLVWPQFLVNSKWIDVEEIYEPLIQIALGAAHEFRNDGETLFDAIDRTPIDFFNKTCTSDCPTSRFDLSRFVLADEGLFATRDQVFQQFGLLRNTFGGQVFEILFGGKKSV